MKKYILAFLAIAFFTLSSAFAEPHETTVTFAYFGSGFDLVHKIVISYVDPLSYPKVNKTICIGLGTRQCPMHKTIKVYGDEGDDLQVNYAWAWMQTKPIYHSNGEQYYGGTVKIHGNSVTGFDHYFRCKFYDD